MEYNGGIYSASLVQHYFKLPYTGWFSSHTQKRINYLTNVLCNNTEIGSLLNLKDPIPNGLCSCVAYKFSSAGCNACYIGETSRHFNTRPREHLKTDSASYIYKHLDSSETCCSVYKEHCFEIIDQASNYYDM